MEEALISLLKKIADTVPQRFTFLSEYPEGKELTAYALEKYGHWQGVREADKVFLGRLYNKLFYYRYYNRNSMADDVYINVPFHCYEITPGDVVFTTSTLEWSDDQQQYVGVTAELYINMSCQLQGIESPWDKEKRQKAEQQPTPPAPLENQSSKFGIAVLVATLILSAACLLFAMIRSTH